MTKLTALFVAALCLAACAESNESTDTAAKPTTSQTAEKKTNKFKQAAIQKIQHITAGISAEQATCVVENMTADGRVGIGEINQMAQDQGHVDSQTSTVTKAYKAALAACIRR